MAAVNAREIELVVRLVDRLERLSADSLYAHQASGLRGSLLRWLERLSSNVPVSQEQRHQLELLVEEGFEILEMAAKEVGGSR